MTTIAIEIGTFITHSDEIKSCKPIITGTGVTVNRIVSWYKLGLTPEEILNRIGHPRLNLAEIYAALSYYHANQKQIETELSAELGEADQFEQEWLQFNQK
ncbi:MAG: DUF433 domain-containing protein [Crocosphaera sp.]|nr:DUF433 domain-containing protein [Crocosphaera sp.]